MLGQGSGTLGGVTLFEEVCHVRAGFETLLLATWVPVFVCFPSEQDIELLIPPTPCLHICYHILV